jgi:hypothetical protein
MRGHSDLDDGGGGDGLDEEFGKGLKLFLTGEGITSQFNDPRVAINDMITRWWSVKLHVD